ncbi:MAG: hypothetical protein JST32_14210, partial [Bacteroidetes bacterium]|nr:hypothetical protein [Bacteroidota bacterium]
AVQGLEDGKFDVARLLPLFKKIAKLNLDREYRLYIVWAIDYFIKNRTVDEELLQILVDYAINDPDPSEDQLGQLHEGINTVRGAAASRIPEFYFDPELKEMIFSTMEKIVNDKVSAVRVAALFRISYLNNLDVYRGYEIFLKFIDKPDPTIFKASLISINYMINHDFNRLIPFLQKACEMADLEEDVATVLAVAFITGKQASYPLLENIVKKHTNAVKGAINVAITNIFDQDSKVQAKCEYLFKKFLNENDKEVAQKYGVFFLRLEPEKFIRILPLIKQYSESKVAILNPHYFYEYLLKCVKKHPMQCLNLMRNWKNYETPDITQSGYYDYEPLSIVIGCYNALRNTNEGRKYIDRALNMFDDMLKIDRFRSSANKVISQVES